MRAAVEYTVGGSLTGPGQGASGLQDNRKINHAAIQLDRGAVRSRVRLDDTMRLGQFFTGRRQAFVNGTNLARMNAQLAPEAVANRPQRVGSQPLGIIDFGSDAIDCGCQSKNASRDRLRRLMRLAGPARGPAARSEAK